MTHPGIRQKRAGQIPYRRIRDPYQGIGDLYQGIGDPYKGIGDPFRGIGDLYQGICDLYTAKVLLRSQGTFFVGSRTRARTKASFRGAGGRRPPPPKEKKKRKKKREKRENKEKKEVVHKVCTQKNVNSAPLSPVAGSTFPYTQTHCHECHRSHVFGFFSIGPTTKNFVMIANQTYLIPVIPVYFNIKFK